MLQQSDPDDYVVATGKTHSVRELCELAFSEAGLDYGDYVKIDQTVYRPAEVDLLIGDASKAQSVLHWQPRVDFAGLIKEMVHADLAALASAPRPEPVLTRA
jgi:GDPmannose 4,6-dehydratase